MDSEQTEGVYPLNPGALRGSVIQQGDAGYDDARKLYNAMIDKRPKLIAFVLEGEGVTREDVV